MRIILASQSPFRRYALDLLGLDYEVIPSNIDEKSIRDADPRKLVEKIAETKALSVAAQHPNALIIASDAVVSLDGQIYEKPRDQREASEMLAALSGQTFEFLTALVVYNGVNNVQLSTVQGCEISFRPLLKHEIQDYIKRYPVLQCAGAFEHDGLLRFSTRVNGSYNFRTALPVSELVLFLRTQGVSI